MHSTTDSLNVYIIAVAHSSLIYIPTNNTPFFIDEIINFKRLIRFEQLFAICTQTDIQSAIYLSYFKDASPFLHLFHYFFF